MTLAQPQCPATDGGHSLEVRWIFPGQLETAVTRWFECFPVAVQSRVDTYLLSPDLPGLSVKVRGFGPLEVKLYGGSPGILDVAGRARGRIESWQKWSFPLRPAGPVRSAGPLRPPGPHAAGPASWRPVRKRRRISRFPARGPARSKAELTEIHTCGRAWWTLAFEATGPARLLRGELRATAALVFAQALPGGVIPGTDNSTSYAEWLRGRPVSAPITPPAARATWA
jgi:hypothetical protein